jgi:prepilin-type N-terminal cleavage/methylation domain-containing protein
MDARFTILAGSRPAARPAGFTLIEMAVTLALTAVMLMAFYGFVAAHAMSSYEDCSEIRIQSDIRKTMVGLTDELESAHLYGLDPMAAWVQYQVPKTGVSGALILDVNGNKQWGVWPPGTSNAAPAGFQVSVANNVWYYQLMFIDSTDPKDQLIESAQVNSLNASGQNLSGTLGPGSSNFAPVYTDTFVFGHFEVWCVNVVNNGAPTYQVVRSIPGKCLRQYDATKAVPANPTGWPVTQLYGQTYQYGGGFFFLRNVGGTGGQGEQNSGTALSAQESFYWFNYPIVQGYPSVQEDADCEPFNDSNGNCVCDGVEQYTDKNNSGTWQAKLRIQVRSFDTMKLASQSPNQRDVNAVIRLLTARVQNRN